MSENIPNKAAVMLSSLRWRLVEAHQLLRHAALPDGEARVISDLLGAADLAVSTSMEAVLAEGR